MKNLAERRAERSLDHLALDSPSLDPLLVDDSAFPVTPGDETHHALDRQIEDSTVAAAFYKHISRLMAERLVINNRTLRALLR